MLLTDHLTLSEPGKQRDATQAARPPSDVSSSEPEVTPGGTSLGTPPLRAPLLSRTEAERGPLGLLAERRTGSWEQHMAFSTQCLLRTFEVRSPALALSDPQEWWPGGTSRDCRRVLGHRRSEDTEGL